MKTNLIETPFFLKKPSFLSPFPHSRSLLFVPSPLHRRCIPPSAQHRHIPTMKHTWDPLTRDFMRIGSKLGRVARERLQVCNSCILSDDNHRLVVSRPSRQPSLGRTWLCPNYSLIRDSRSSPQLVIPNSLSPKFLLFRVITLIQFRSCIYNTLLVVSSFM